MGQPESESESEAAVPFPDGPDPDAVAMVPVGAACLQQPLRGPNNPAAPAGDGAGKGGPGGQTPTLGSGGPTTGKGGLDNFIGSGAPGSRSQATGRKSNHYFDCKKYGGNTNAGNRTSCIGILYQSYHGRKTLEPHVS